MTYVKPTISNYNDDAPADDGSATTANKVKWSKVKDELSDPIKNYADAINNAVEDGFLQLFLANHDTKTTGFTPSATLDDGKLFVCTSPLTCTLPVAADAGEGYLIGILNISGGTITGDGNASELINGAATFTSTADYELTLYSCTGTAWYATKIASVNSPITVKDTLFTLQDNSDTTKQAQFQLSGITTATTRTYTLPDASSTLADIATAQTLTNKTLGAGTIFSAGVVRQVVSVEMPGTFTSSGNSWQDITGLSASITPRATSSKILVVVQTQGDSNTNHCFLKLVRTSTDIHTGTAASSRTVASAQINALGSSGAFQSQAMILHLDSPSTASSVTYKVQGIVPSSGTFYINRSQTDTDAATFARTASTITLIEIEG